MFYSLLCLSDFLSLELVDGYPRLLMDYGSGTLELRITTETRLNDSAWHRLDVLWNTDVNTFLLTFIDYYCRILYKMRSSHLYDIMELCILRYEKGGVHEDCVSIWRQSRRQQSLFPKMMLVLWHVLLLYLFWKLVLSCAIK